MLSFSNTRLGNFLMTFWLSFLYYVGILASFTAGIALVVGSWLALGLNHEKVAERFGGAIVAWFLSTLALASFVIIGAQFRALFVLLLNRAYGIEIGDRFFPSLHKALTDEIYRDTNGRPFDCIYLLPDPSVGVMELRAFPLLSKNRSALLIGWPLIKACTIEELRAVIAHEQAHFDENAMLLWRQVYRIRVGTINSAWVLGLWRVRDPGLLSLVLMLATTFNKGFLRWYLPYLNSIAKTANYQAEYYCDATSAAKHGANVFLRGLRQTVVCQLAFEKFLQRHKRSLGTGDNLYPTFLSFLDEFSNSAGQEIGRRLEESSDTHPSYRDREAKLSEMYQSNELSSRRLVLDPKISEEIEYALTLLQRSVLIEEAAHW
jgi:Zn-dependent protease with chaperone function